VLELIFSVLTRRLLVFPTLISLFGVVADSLVEFEKQLIQIQDYRRIIDLFREMYRVFFQLNKEKPKDVNM
jgi:hypothetical protein